MNIFTRRALIAGFIAAAVISSGDPFAKAQTIEDEAVKWLTDFIQVDTTNPDGNESRAVDFYSAIFDAEGIAWQSAESAPGRGNIWARIEGGDEPALILIQHTDVVPADPNYWTADPLGAEVRDGYLYGRGAIDMKSTGISHLAIFLELHRAGRALNRDVIFVATADEEAGGLFGAGWLIENHPEIFDGAGILLNEGGGGSNDGSQTTFNIEVTQKVPVWLRLTAIDTPGHGSMPNATSSVSRIVRALNRILDNPGEPRIIPAVDIMFKGLAPTQSDDWKEAYGDIATAVKEDNFLARLQEKSAYHHALTRDTCSLTRFEASNKINVVPPEAWAEIDCRILPDRTSESFVAEMQALIADTGVEISVNMAFTPAVSSTRTPLYQAISETMLARYPDSLVVPVVSAGFTDSHFTRDLGIDSYGFNPLILPIAEFLRIHGNDERINIADFQNSIADLKAIVDKVVYD